MAVGVLVEGRPAGSSWAGWRPCSGAAVVGITRRQAVERTEQLARQVKVEVARTEVERARAELLGERNHLAREIHDVLAHTLPCASSSRRSARWSRRTPTPAPPSASSCERTRMLVHEGLDEARGAVRALRETARPRLGDQLTKLSVQQMQPSASPGSVPATCGLHRIRGTGDPPGADRLGLLPGGPGGTHQRHESMRACRGRAASVALTWSPEVVALSVENDAPRRRARPLLLGRSGGGQGLRGHRRAPRAPGGRGRVRGRRHRAGRTASVPLGGVLAPAERRRSGVVRGSSSPTTRGSCGRAWRPSWRVPRHRGRGSGRGRRRGPGARRGTGSRRGADGPAHAPDGRGGRHPGRAGAAPHHPGSRRRAERHPHRRPDHLRRRRLHHGRVDRRRGRLPDQGRGPRRHPAGVGGGRRRSVGARPRRAGRRCRAGAPPDAPGAPPPTGVRCPTG